MKSPAIKAAALTRNDRRILSELEGTIARHKESFFKVGFALQEIRDSRLYRDNYSTFDAYLKNRWGLARSYASRLIMAAEAGEKLLTIVNSPTGKIEIAPLRETQVRAIKNLPEADRLTVWRKGVELSGGTQPTERTLRELAREICPSTTPQLDQISADRRALTKAQWFLRSISKPSKNITAALDLLSRDVESGGEKLSHSDII